MRPSQLVATLRFSFLPCWFSCIVNRQPWRRRLQAKALAGCPHHIFVTPRPRAMKGNLPTGSLTFQTFLLILHGTTRGQIGLPSPTYRSALDTPTTHLFSNLRMARISSRHVCPGFMAVVVVLSLKKSRISRPCTTVSKPMGACSRIKHCLENTNQTWLSSTFFHPLLLVITYISLILLQRRIHLNSMLVTTMKACPGMFFDRSLLVYRVVSLTSFEFLLVVNTNRFDTRLIYPYNHRYPSHGSPSRDGKKIIVTSQKAEILRNADWVELYDDSVLGLQISLIGTLDPEGLLNRKDESAVQRYMQEKTMTRWYYYDEKVEQAEFEKRRTGSKWTPMATDVARLKCSSRPSHLSALPCDKTKSDVHVRPVSAVRVHSKAQEDVYHRRLAALTGGDWFTIKDKNWVPFHYQERLLWSYTIEPHIVCENDIDVNYIDEVDCVICVRKHQSSSPKTFDKLQKRIKGTGFDKVDVHLNGAPAYYVEEIDSYLGILHVIKIKHSKDVLGLQTKERFYEHYFYKTEAQPPFRVTEIAASRVPLERSQCWSPWFETDDTVQVEFVMYMQYHPDRPGKEIVLSYGEADRTARVTTLSMKTVFEAFHDSSLS